MTSNSGKRLEELVAFIEREFTPQGFKVEVNTNVRDMETGVVIAEFDIRVRGQLGTTHIDWLIECRDRSGSGSAPASWIEQLVGRRNRFHFNKVTAVSTTGFSAPAVKLARDEGIELREVRSLDSSEFHWLKTRHVIVTGSNVNLAVGVVIPDPSQPVELQEAAKEAIRGRKLSDAILVLDDGRTVSPLDEFVRVLNLQPQWIEDIKPNDPPKTIKARVNYRPESAQFLLITSAGPVRIGAIEFEGTCSLTQYESPLTRAARYSKIDTGERIADIATFEFTANDENVVLEMRRLKATEETLVVVSKSPVVKDDKT